MAKRNILAHDIIEVSFQHWKNPHPMGTFTARVAAVGPVNTDEDAPASLMMLDKRKHKDFTNWQFVRWEQRSANRTGVFLLPPDGVNVPWVPRVKLVRRPR